MKYLYLTLASILILLGSCSKSTPEAYVIKPGMTREEVLKALEEVNLTPESIKEEDDEDDEDEDYTAESEEIDDEESPTPHQQDIDIRQELEYMGITWNSMSISFNSEGLVDQVSFYQKDGYFNKSTLIENLSKELGEKSGGGSLTSWGEENKWLVSVADNKEPFPKCLTYWYIEYMDKDKSSISESSLEENDDQE